MPEIMYLSIMLIAGVLMAKAVSIIKMPKVTGYLLAGLFIGPSFLNLVPESIAVNMGIITQMTLGFIAFTIGNEMNVTSLRKIGPKAFIISFFQAFSAGFVVVLSMFFLFRQSLPFSLVLGAIAMSTAPTATLLVIRQYKAKGPLVNMLLFVVAIDDVIGIVFFSIAVAVAGALMHQTANSSLWLSILNPLWEITGSVIVGFLLGIILTWVNQKIKNDTELLVLAIAFVFFGAGLAIVIHLSSLLLCMAMGASFASLAQQKDRMMFKLENFVPPIYIAFYTLAGINLHISTVKEVGLIGIGYIVIRIVGKVAGAWFGAWKTHSPDVIRRYLGFTLLTQAGVVIGLAMLASTAFPEFGPKIQTIILGATVIYELIGPFLAKTCLFKAGEIDLETYKNNG
jgi:Kef-type K+ transport system membrane component KefB